MFFLVEIISHINENSHIDRVVYVSWIPVSLRTEKKKRTDGGEILNRVIYEY